ncbi:MAG: shikimate dehydrogenase [Gammaproteobacteria bacterium]|nr:shikimate dehydrogenase [Gammaproteobacteria bacterium]
MTFSSSFTLAEDVDNYCVIGDPISHSKSPQIHQLFAEQSGQILHYQAIAVTADEFDEALLQLHRQGIKGLNVTLPHKSRACSWVKAPTGLAERAGAVNTIWFGENEQTYGDNTDGKGLVKDLLANAITLSERNVLILGAGGAVCGIIEALFDAGVARITITNRTLTRAEEIQNRFSTIGEIQVYSYDSVPANLADIVINATSASLQQQVPPLADQLIAGRDCYDLAYADSDTAFITWAKVNGARTAIDGLGMLVRQAAESFFIWRGIRPEVEPVIAELR